MKEFTIEEFDVNSDDLSVSIDYYFFSELKNISFDKEQIQEVFNVSGSLYEWLLEEFGQNECLTLLRHFIREYKDKRRLV